MNQLELLSIILGAISVSLAIGLPVYFYWKEKKDKEKNELFFVERIQDNLSKMAQYFLSIDKETKFNESFEKNNQNMLDSLSSFYRRNEQEMKDILYQTKLYLPFWNSISIEDKRKVDEILNLFSWLLYDYFPSSVSESLRELSVINNRKPFANNKQFIMDNTDLLLKKYM